MSNNILHIGTSNQYVRLTFPVELEKGWSGNFHAEVKDDLFSAAATCWQNPDGSQGIFSLGEQLRRMNDQLDGQAEFRPIERQIEFALKMNQMGSIKIEGVIFRQATYGTRLQFEFMIDQTFLPDIIAQLKRMSV